MNEIEKNDQALIEEMIAKVSKLLPCLDSYCDLSGTTVGGQYPVTGEYEPLQCEYCYRTRFPILDETKITFISLLAQKNKEREEAVDEYIIFLKATLRREAPADLAELVETFIEGLEKVRKLQALNQK